MAVVENSKFYGISNWERGYQRNVKKFRLKMHFSCYFAYEHYGLLRLVFNEQDVADIFAGRFRIALHRQRADSDDRSVPL